LLALLVPLASRALLTLWLAGVARALLLSSAHLA
jgi:hypothetical protein